MTLPPEVRVLPGHTDETTIGREWEENLFVRYWRRADSTARTGGPARCTGRRRRSSSGRRTTTARARRSVRLTGGDESIVGASRIEGI